MDNQYIEEIHKKLVNEVTDMHYRWQLYCEVYGGSQEEFTLLNTSGSNFFYYVRHLMVDQMALSFSKLTDPNRTKIRGSFVENLSLKQIHVFANETKNSELLDIILPIYKELEENCAHFRLLRNKRIAHGDLNHAMKVADEPLPGISQLYVETALENLRRYMNAIEMHYFNSETAYDIITSPINNGGIQLMRVLAKGQHA
ncbi:hypothetical protein GNP84_06740 [Aliivibrio fischeri]|uniref:AbiU2 domain-containing protein n=1 Tax=Aliivibrio fischeri TaxID=668 RepID=UPI0012D92BDD|nr:hypothetical protein [Aliivibrio fischeri]MUK76603.1 hypothetical protein [Aliivibrio fischeri]